MTSAFIAVRHNIEVAHRLYETPGKCENIHGHSMWVELKLFGTIDKTGKLAGLEFGAVKKEFRAYLDETFDHHLLLNESDPWASRFLNDVSSHAQELPGLMPMPGDPTTENIAMWIGEWARAHWLRSVSVHVNETHVNAAEVQIP